MTRTSRRRRRDRRVSRLPSRPRWGFSGAWRGTTTDGMVRAEPRGLRDRGAGPAPGAGGGDGRPAGADGARAHGRPAALDLPDPPRRPVLGRQVAVQDQRRLPVLPSRRRPRRGPGRRRGGGRALLPAGRRRVLRGRRDLDAGPPGAREDSRGARGGPRGAGRDRPGAGLPPPVQGPGPGGDADPAAARLRRETTRRAAGSGTSRSPPPAAHGARGRSPRLPATLERDFVALVPLVRWLNRAIGYPSRDRRF